MQQGGLLNVINIFIVREGSYILLIYLILLIIYSILNSNNVYSIKRIYLVKKYYTLIYMKNYNNIRKQLTVDEKEHILNLHERGYKIINIADIYQVNERTIRRIIRKNCA